jgi:hypothetical protein
MAILSTLPPQHSFNNDRVWSKIPEKGDLQMKQIAAFLIGTGLILGTVSFAQDTTDTTKKTEKKGKKKKGGDDTTADDKK